MELQFTKFGSGCPLVILHGLYGSGSNWLSIGRALSEHFTVYLVDQRNHGNSPHADEFNYDVMAEDLETFLEQNQLDNICLMGHSMGGKVAMNFALAHPERVRKLVIIDIALRSYIEGAKGASSLQHNTHSKIISALKRLDLDFAETREELDRQLARDITQKEVRQFLLKNVKRSSGEAFSWGINLNALDENLEAVLDAINFSQRNFPGPALAIYGSKSGYINEQDKQDFKQAFPKIKLLEFNTGHWVHAEEPDRLIETLTDFLPITE